jgi:medium-chain acyl-[acyl-carrier-protein] hydrolase
MTSRSHVQRSSPNPDARLKLFCFPYAGGSAAVFRPWSRAASSDVEICAIQYPGHGHRYQERSCTRIAEIVHGLVSTVSSEMDRPSAFFGHSMGALVAYELARELHRRGGPRPLVLFLSARAGPAVKRTRTALHLLSGRALQDALRRMDGTPPEILENDDLMDLVEPLLRADFEACYTYEHARHPILDIPVHALGGVGDHDTPRAQLAGWADVVQAPVAVRMFTGGHFFIHECPADVISYLITELKTALAAVGATGSTRALQHGLSL